MRDITNNVLARKSAPKIQHLFSKTKMFTAAIAISALGIFGMGLSLVSAASPVNWTGQGTTNGVLDTTQCTASNSSYLLWVFTLGGGNEKVTSATLHLGGSGTGDFTMVKTGHEMKATTPYFNLSTLTANVTYTGTLGRGNANLVISHGCPGGTSVTTTTLMDSANNIVIEGSSVPLGSMIHDTATVTLTPSAVPTGSVSFRFYTSAAGCTADTTFTGGAPMGTAALNGSNPGVADPSTATAALTPGTYAFRAQWPGMTGYLGSTSTCETFTVTKAQLGVNTTVHSNSPDQALTGNLNLGDGAHDSATVTGGVSGFTLPSVTFYFFDKGVACTNGDTTGATQLNTLAPDSNGVAHPSTSETNLAAGTYNFMAVVAGDSNYDGYTSDCEPFTVNKAQLSISTIVHDAAHQDITSDSVALGSIVHDTATVNGGVAGFEVPASVSFTLTTGYTDSCANGATVATDGMENTAYKSADTIALGAGDYSFRASVEGNDNYIGADSTCEPFTVNKAQLSVSTNIHNADHQIVSSVATGAIVHDTAALSGAVSGFATPAITFTFYTNNACTGDGTAVANTGADEGDSTLARSANSAALAAGLYAYKASAVGNSNYLGDSSDCEPLTVNAYWCSPGFWTQNYKNLVGTPYDITGLLGVHYNTISGAAALKSGAPSDPTIKDMLDDGASIYGGPAMNSVADYLSAHFGWFGTTDNCPIDAHGNFVGTL